MCGGGQVVVGTNCPSTTNQDVEPFSRHSRGSRLLGCSKGGPRSTSGGLGSPSPPPRQRRRLGSRSATTEETWRGRCQPCKGTHGCNGCGHIASNESRVKGCRWSKQSESHEAARVPSSDTCLTHATVEARVGHQATHQGRPASGLKTDTLSMMSVLEVSWVAYRGQAFGRVFVVPVMRRRYF